MANTFGSPGDVFVGEAVYNGFSRIVKIAPDGTKTLFATLNASPYGIVVDLAGNVFVSVELGTIYKFTPEGVQSTFASSAPGANDPFSTGGLALDAAGNLYLADYTHFRILKFNPSGKRSPFGTEIANPLDLAVDSKGNVFATTGLVEKFTPKGRRSTFGYARNPWGLAIDREHDHLFVATAEGRKNIPLTTIVQFLPDGTRSRAFTSAGGIDGIASDRNGYLYAAFIAFNAATGLFDDTFQILKIAPDGSSTVLASGLESVIPVATQPYPAPYPSPSPTPEPAATPSVEFASTAYEVQEEAGSVALTLTRTGDLSKPASIFYAPDWVYYNATDADAYPGYDFRDTIKTADFPTGVTSKTITIPIVDDTTPERTQTFRVILYNTAHTSAGKNKVATVTITDHDGPRPTIQFEWPTYGGKEHAPGGAIKVTVERVGNQSTAVTAHYATSDGTARAGSDYVATWGQVSFSPGGSNLQTISIPVLNDHVHEQSEEFTVTLTQDSETPVGPNTTARVKIVDFD